ERRVARRPRARRLAYRVHVRPRRRGTPAIVRTTAGSTREHHSTNDTLEAPACHLVAAERRRGGGRSRRQAMDERTDAQELEHAAQAWRRYVDTGRVDPGLLRSCTYLSWQRCAQQGTDPHTVRWTTLSGEETAVLLERERDLIAAAR